MSSITVPNPQDVIRELLAEHGFIRKKGAEVGQMGDKSDWEPGQSIKVSFYVRMQTTSDTKQRN